MGRLRQISGSPRRTAMLLLALGGLAIFLINFPGSMENDSYVQLLEGRTQSYSGWHPAVMSWLLGLFDALPGPVGGWFTALTNLMAFGGLIAILAMPKQVSWLAVFVALALLALPQMLLLQAVVIKDTLFSNAVLMGFALLGLVPKFWLHPALRNTAIFGAGAFIALAALARQNGIVVLPAAAFALGLVAGRHGGLWQGLRSAGLIVLVTLAVWQGGEALLKLRWDGYPAKQEQFKILQIYDITGMVKRNPELPLSVFDREAPGMARTVRGEGVAHWTPRLNDTLQTKSFVAMLDATPAETVSRQWRELVAQYPAHYLGIRATLFRWVFQPPDVGQCHPFHVGDQGAEEDLNALGMTPRLDARDLVLWRIGDLYLKTPAFSHGLYALIAAGLLVLFWRRRSAGDVVMAGMILAAFTFTATFFVISIACDYRYLYLIDLSALASLLYAATDWRRLVSPPLTPQFSSPSGYGIRRKRD